MNNSWVAEDLTREAVRGKAVFFLTLKPNVIVPSGHSSDELGLGIFCDFNRGRSPVLTDVVEG